MQESSQQQETCCGPKADLSQFGQTHIDQHQWDEGPFMANRDGSNPNTSGQYLPTLTHDVYSYPSLSSSLYHFTGHCCPRTRCHRIR